MPELHITPENYERYTGAGHKAVDFGGHRRWLNAVDRRQPYGQTMFARPIEETISLIPRDQWKAAVDANEQNGTWLLNRAQAAGVKVKDQNGLGYCFPAGTKVLMDNGLERGIETITKGDEVITTRGIARKVINLFVRHYKGAMTTIHLFGGKRLLCTPEHPVLTMSGFKAASEIHAGHVFCFENGIGFYRPVTGNSMEERPEQYVFNLEVDGDHTYIADGVGVHNCHAYGTVSCIELARASAGLPFIELSAESVGGPVTNWRNAGAYPDDDLRVCVEQGACEQSYMDKRWSLKPNNWKQGWKENAKQYRVLETFKDLTVPGKTWDAMMTCTFLAIPFGNWYNWWSHHIHGGFKAKYENGRWWILMRNSWGEEYGEDGYFWLSEGTGRGQGTATGAFAVPVATWSPA